MLIVFRNCMAIAAALYFFLFYRRLRGYLIGFPLYFYLAFFPYKFSVAGREITDPMLKGLLLIEILLLLRAGGKRFKVFMYPFVLIGIIILCGTVASSYSGYFFPRTFMTGVINITYIFLLLILLLNRIKSREAMEVIFDCMCHNAVFLCLCAVIERFVLMEPRAKLSMFNPNYFAFYLAIVLCIAFFEKKRRKLIPLILFGILLTKSGAVMLGIGLCMIICALSKVLTPRCLTRVTMFIIPLIPMTGVLLVGLGAYSRYDLIMRLIAWKDPVRIGIWTDGLRDFLAKPLFGYGYNCWLSHSTSIPYVTHNDFLRILVDCGLVGMFIFIVGWVTIARKISKSENALFYLLLVAVSVMFSCMHNNLNSYMNWLCIVMVYFDQYLSPVSRRTSIDSRKNFGLTYAEE